MTARRQRLQDTLLVIGMVIILRCMEAYFGKTVYHMAYKSGGLLGIFFYNVTVICQIIIILFTEFEVET